ncbi:flagellar hook-associated protein FlgK, partial [Burkholderia multivorans]|nr:flagellar hook-associated protein FlgK [Burkholderia multivorans]
QSASMPASIGGLNFSFSSGAMNAGDKFTVQPTRGALNGFGLATSNGSAIAAASPYVPSATKTNTGTGTIGGLSVTSATAAANPHNY